MWPDLLRNARLLPSREVLGTAEETLGSVSVILDPWFGVMKAQLENFPAYPHPGKTIDGWVITSSQ
tara:strand:+ start:516 stop:713 length:198 start_codon:yes stop_codon:yes gene_type:complete